MINKNETRPGEMFGGSHFCIRGFDKLAYQLNPALQNAFFFYNRMNTETEQISMTKKILVFAILLTLLALTACAASQTGGDPAPVQALETYLQALANKDEARVSSMVCPEWEADALLEYDSFQAVETALEGLDCQQTGSEGDTALVNCQGKIQATYSNEVQEFDLSNRTYRMIRQGEDWQVCGFDIQ